MPMDGLGSDAGRQSLTEVGAAGARAPRPHARPSRAALVAQRAPLADVEPLLAPATLAAGTAAPRPRAGLRGERLVAVCALAVLAFAAVFFVERIGGLRDLPTPAPSVETTLEAPALPEVDTVPVAPGPTSEAVQTVRTAHAAPAVRRNAQRVATVRKPEGKSPRRAEPEAAPLAAAPHVVSDAPPALVDDPPFAYWERMHAEVSACAGHEYFHETVLCDQRVRLRFCDAWWGRAAECPSGRQADYGN